MLETEIKKLREAIEANTAALVGLSMGEPVDQPEPAPEPEEKPKAKAKAKPKAKAEPKEEPKEEPKADEIDFEEIKQITLGLSRSGKKDLVRAKLDDMGVKRLTDLSETDLAIYAEWVRAQ